MVGPCEENEYIKPPITSQDVSMNVTPDRNIIKKFITDIKTSYFTLDEKLKQLWINETCPHPNGCLHYISNVCILVLFF